MKRWFLSVLLACMVGATMGAEPNLNDVKECDVLKNFTVQDVVKDGKIRIPKGHKIPILRQWADEAGNIVEQRLEMYDRTEQGEQDAIWDLAVATGADPATMAGGFGCNGNNCDANSTCTGNQGDSQNPGWCNIAERCWDGSVCTRNGDCQFHNGCPDNAQSCTCIFCICTVSGHSCCMHPGGGEGPWPKDTRELEPCVPRTNGPTCDAGDCGCAQNWDECYLCSGPLFN